MKTVYQYAIEADDSFEIELPQGAEVLCVQTLRGRPYIWALISPNRKRIPRTFRLISTGQTLEHDGLRYVGTFHLQDGSISFHLFEVLP